jgi:hypothetical protein
MMAERYIDGYGRARLAVVFDDYDKSRGEQINALDWDSHHQSRDDDYEWRDGQTRVGTWTVDHSDDAIRSLRGASGKRVPTDPPWNVDVYHTSAGANPRECESCREEAVLGAKGLRATNMHNSAAFAVVSDGPAEQVCTSCYQFYAYQRTETSATGGGISGGTPVHEVM